MHAFDVCIIDSMLISVCVCARVYTGPALMLNICMCLCVCAAHLLVHAKLGDELRQQVVQRPLVLLVLSVQVCGQHEDDLHVGDGAHAPHAVQLGQVLQQPLQQHQTHHVQPTDRDNMATSKPDAAVTSHTLIIQHNRKQGKTCLWSMTMDYRIGIYVLETILLKFSQL